MIEYSIHLLRGGSAKIDTVVMRRPCFGKCALLLLCSRVSGTKVRTTGTKEPFHSVWRSEINRRTFARRRTLGDDPCSTYTYLLDLVNFTPPIVQINEKSVQIREINFDDNKQFAVLLQPH